MWFFEDLCSGYEAIFSNEEKADAFIKAYGLKMYDLNGQFPIIDNDYTLRDCKADPDINEFNEFFS